MLNNGSDTSMPEETRITLTSEEIIEMVVTLETAISSDRELLRKMKELDTTVLDDPVSPEEIEKNIEVKESAHTKLMMVIEENQLRD